MPDAAARWALSRLDDEIAEHVEQDVPGEHGDERPKPKAERPDQEAETNSIGAIANLNDQRRVLRHEQREEMQPVLPEADAEHDREGDQRHDAGEGELAGDGERMSRGDHAERHVAHEIGEQQEDEGR